MSEKNVESLRDNLVAFNQGDVDLWADQAGYLRQRANTAVFAQTEPKPA